MKLLSSAIESTINLIWTTFTGNITMLTPLGNSVPRILTKTTRTPSPEETNNLLKVYPSSLRNAIPPLQYFPGLCWPEVAAIVPSLLQADSIHPEDPWNVLPIWFSQHRTTPEQAKIYLGNHFRANAHLTDVDRIDWLVDIGYELLHDAEWQFTNTGYLYKYFMAPNGVLNDHGRDRFD